MDSLVSSEEFPVQSSYTYWISRLSNLMQERFNHMLKDQGISWPQWMVLNVMNQGIARTPAAIADHLGTDRSAVTRLLDRLEDKGVIVREHDKLDRRSVTVHITDQGRAMMSKLNESARQHQRQFLSGLHSTEFRALKANIQKMLKAGGVDSTQQWRQQQF